MQLISKVNKEFRFLLCVIDISSKYAWVISLKDNKRITTNNAFQQILKESNRKSNKMWVDKDINFIIDQWNHGYKNDIEMYSTHNEGKSVVAERFIRTLRNKICKYIIYDFHIKKCVY